MATSTITGIGEVERRHLVKAGAQALLGTAIVLTVYYTFPLAHRPHQSVVLRLGVGLALFVAALVTEIRSITKSRYPILRAGVAMAIIIPLFLIVFAWTYLTMSNYSPGTFGRPLDRTSALYFAVTIFSTVGFGDITPHTDGARLVTSVQMIADLAVIAVVIRLILGAATRGQASMQVASGTDAEPSAAPSDPI